MTQILLIEDEDLIRENIETMLQLAGYDVLTAANGLIGLKMARENLPDLIICDIMMPELDGYGVLQELRKESNTVALPFIFLTAKGEKSDQRQGMNLGADDYLVKPFAEADLLEAVRVRLQKYDSVEKVQQHRFAQHLMQAAEVERQHLARELHDELGTQLVNIKLMLDMSRNFPELILQQSLESVRTSVDQLLNDLKELAYRLHPVLIEQMGLLPTILWYVERYTRQTGVQVRFEHMAIAGRRINPQQEIALFRIIQEAFDNVAQHAQTSELFLLLWAERSKLHLQITDQGCGFSLEGVKASAKMRGLQLMQEYAAAVRGNVIIDSTPGGGTQIMGVFPDSFVDGYTDSNKAIEPDGKSEPITQSAKKSSLITVLLVTDHQPTYQQIQTLFAPNPDVLMCPIVPNDPVKIAEQLAELIPDLIILDSIKGDRTDLMTVAQLLREQKVILLSLYRDSQYVNQVLEQGIMGYVLKEQCVSDLPDAVRTVMAGQRYTSPTLAATVEIANQVPWQAQPQHLNLELVLSPREQEILRLILADLSYKDISKQLSISPRTVEKHRANIMHKLGLRSHKELFLFAVQYGLI